MHDRAGSLYERMGLIQPAMDAYRRGHAYRQAGPKEMMMMMMMMFWRSGT